MSAPVVVKIAGLAELNRKLTQIAPRVARNVTGKAVASAAVVVRDAAKAKAPIYSGPVAQGHPPPGTLRRSIAIRRSKRQSSASKVTYEVFVRHWGRSGKTKKQRAQGVAAYSRFDAFYWFMVEFGTAKMAARPFMRPGFESSKERALQRMQAMFASGIEAEAKAR